MSRMSGQMRNKRYPLLVERSGEVCNFCGNDPEIRQLVIDHIDNDNSNNDLENLQLLCRRCNKIKKHTRTVDKCVKEIKEETSIQKNRKCEPIFREIVYRDLLSQGKKNLHEMKNEGAEILGLSPVTVGRYLDKMCSLGGSCRVINDMIELNPNSMYLDIQLRTTLDMSRVEILSQYPLSSHLFKNN